jgi:hypothetical protein
VMVEMKINSHSYTVNKQNNYTQKYEHLSWILYLNPYLLSTKNIEEETKDLVINP